MRQKAKTPRVPETPDTVSNVSRASKKEIDEVHSTDSSALSRFLAARRSSVSTAAGVTPPRAPDSPTARATVKEPRTPRVGSLFSDEESNVLSDVSFFGQSSVHDAAGSHVDKASRQSSKSSNAAGPPKPSASSQALAASAAVARAKGADCALCGRKGVCTDNNCFCPDCSHRMTLLDAGASPTSASEQESTRPAPTKHRGNRSRRSSGSVASGQEASCVLCGQHFLCEDQSQSSVLCPRCLAQH